MPSPVDAGREVSPPALCPPAEPLDPLLPEEELLPVEEVLPDDPESPEPGNDGAPLEGEVEGDGSEGAGLEGVGMPGLPEPLVLAQEASITATTDTAETSSGRIIAKPWRASR